jgi:hypothetical protein
VKQQHTERVNVRALIGVLAAEQLRCHVQRCAGDVPPGAYRSVLVLMAGAKVHEDHSAAVFAHHVPRRHISMEQTCRVDSCQRATEFRANARRLSRAHRTLLLDDLIQRAPADKFHPDADRTIPRLGPINGDHIGVTHSRQQSSFVDDARRIADRCQRIVECFARAQQLERHLALEVGIPGAIDVAERPGSNTLQQLQMTPARRLLGNVVAHRRRLAAIGFAWLRRTMHCRDLSDDLQLTDHGFVVGSVGRVERTPVDRRAVEDRRSEDAEFRLFIHAPFPRPT